MVTHRHFKKSPNLSQGAALAEELLGLRNEVGGFGSALQKLQRQRADERSELLELQAALQVHSQYTIIVCLYTVRITCRWTAAPSPSLVIAAASHGPQC